MAVSKPYFLGVDIGTSSCKALAVSIHGEALTQHQIENNISHPKPDYSEQDPDALLQAVIQVIRFVVKKLQKQPISVSFSFAMHSLMAVDQAGKPLTALLIWSDNRSHQAAEHFRKKEQAQTFYTHTGTPIHPMSPFIKLLWWRNNQPELFNKAYKFISIQEYIFFQFFREYAISYSMASATGLFDHSSLQWYQPALTYLGIQPKQLSTPQPSTRIFKTLQQEIVNQIGIQPDVSFILGAGDGCLANIGTGVWKEGEMAVNIGTSGAVRIFGSKAIPFCNKNQGQLFNYLLREGEYISGAAVNNGGNLLDWGKGIFLNVHKKAPDYKSLLQEAFKADPGCGGLVFLPYLFGERAPLWNVQTRGSFFGISYQHEQKDFLRAVIEGIGYALYQNALLLEENITSAIDKIYLSGGFSHSQDWIRVLTDIFGKESSVSQQTDASALGAIILGMRTEGFIHHWKDAQKFIRKPSVHFPRKAQHEVYQKNFKIFTALEKTTRTLRQEIAEQSIG